jgi:hypothetical protein
MVQYDYFIMVESLNVTGMVLRLKDSFQYELFIISSHQIEASTCSNTEVWGP